MTEVWEISGRKRDTYHTERECGSLRKSFREAAEKERKPPSLVNLEYSLAAGHTECWSCRKVRETAAKRRSEAIANLVTKKAKPKTRPKPARRLFQVDMSPTRRHGTEVLCRKHGWTHRCTLFRCYDE